MIYNLLRGCVKGIIIDICIIELLMGIFMKMCLIYLLLYMKNMSNFYRVYRRNNIYILFLFKKYVLV